jgi:hypothetical protein
MRGRATVAIALVAAGCAGDAASSAGAWEFKIDTTQASAGGPARETSWLRSVGKEGPKGAARSEAVILSFDCLPGHIGTTIMTEQALRQGTVETVLRVDDDSARRIRGFAGTTATGGQVALTIPQESVLAILSGHQRAFIDYADGAGSSQTVAEFPLDSLEKFRGLFLAACAKQGNNPE